MKCSISVLGKTSCLMVFPPKLVHTIQYNTYLVITIIIQEMKAKTNMEGKYSKKCTEVRVAQTQKKCSIEEKNMKDEIEVCYLSLVCSFRNII